MASVWPRALAIGVVAGFASGLLGIGGGVIVVPGLVLLLQMDQYRAAATSVATIVVSASAAEPPGMRWETRRWVLRFR